tara:strand:+ start:18375 stop:18899 length:525 start_codon:yes stop_codon:yes gene_type:complete
MRLTIEVDGAVQFDRAMLVAEDRMGSLFQEIGDDVIGVAIQETKARFKTKGRIGAKPWPPLTDAYARHKKNLHRSDPATYPARGLLRLTDRMFKSLTGKSVAAFGGGGEAIRIVADDHIIYGTATPYAGAQKKWGREPIRFSRRAAGRFQEVMRKGALGVVRDGVEGPPARARS